MLSGVIRKAVSFGVIWSVAGAWILPVTGQTGDGPTTVATEYIERQNIDERLQILGVGLMGDTIDLNIGA